MTGRTVFAGGVLFPVHDPDRDPYRGWFATDAAGTIVEIGAGEAPRGGAAETVVDLGGTLVLPGFVSAHSHLWQSVFRGVADGHGTMAWIEQLHKRFGPALEPGDMYAFTRHGQHDLLRHGITTVCNHTHEFGGGPAEQWQATLDAPQRIAYSFSPPLWLSAAERLSELDKFLHLIAGDRHRVAALSMNTTGPHSVTEMRQESALLAELGIGLHAHYLEDPSVAAGQQDGFDDLVAGGRIGPDTVLAHFIHTTPHIRDTAARAGAAMVWNPLSNGRLGSGIADIPGYRAAGLRIGMGVDGQASADTPDPFQNMRTGLYLLRAARCDAAILDARAVLRMHTLDSAAVLGVAGLTGSLEVGKAADFVVCDPATPWADLPAPQLWPFAVLSMSASDITGVYVGGRRRGGGPGDRDRDLETDCRARVSRLYRAA
ncbi:amidohydrolase family protein [Nocardia sp. alder85J]|uniref:amidohydrolase family protein n=1 Tax=Nocardia sp. alder85J TaxID=2862949 RepID=UPI001CD5A0C6|nr:amidohydrolase family protein [Nocardia sp. alder85J]MCX4098169.1 amidohydrolase family protein [Nocardia sp. alder85J]